MRTSFISIAVITAAFLSASCQKENIQESITANQNAPQFTASIEGCVNTKTTVERVTSPSVAYKTKWENTDEISINSAIYQAIPDGSDATKSAFTFKEGTAPSATYNAYFPASIYNGITASLPASYTYAEGKYNMPMYAQSNNTTLSFKNLCGVLAITVPNSEMTKVSSISVVSDSRMNGAFTSTADGVLTFTSSAELTDADKKVTLAFTTAKTIESSVTFYIPVPAGIHNSLTINVSDGTLMKTMATKKSGGVSISRNVVYPITFADNQPSVFLPGEFSVSDTKKVKFTKGNLYWDGTGSAFHLESSQTVYPTTWNANHVGHFYWSKTATVAYAETYSDSGASIEDAFFCGEANPMTVDGQSGLYALSLAEWSYIRGETAERSGKYKLNVTVNGAANCLVIAPDGYAGTIAETYTAAGWATAEADGLVCLPAAGFRNGSSMNSVGSAGNYWSSTPNAGLAGYAYYRGFNSSNFTPTHGGRGAGRSVRLVATVE